MITTPLVDELKPLLREVEHLRHPIRERYNRDAIVVESPQMHLVVGTAHQLAKTDAIALIQGESGTGKEVIAKAIHAWGHRAEHPFITIDCTTLPETLMESELFGHEKGAFTGALVAKRGLFEEGHGGTIFLDEVGDMSLSAQVKLLRVLQAHTIRRVGSTTPIRIDVRILAATNQDLKTLVRRKAFREDLYYRLNGITLTVPPLRGRREDIPVLASHFLKVFSHRVGREIEGISSEAMEILLRHPWPGNVRELEKTVERAVVLGRSERIVPEDLPASLFGRDDVKFSPPKERVTLAELEKAHILAALSAHQWNQTKVAEELRISRTTLWRKLKKYHIEVLS